MCFGAIATYIINKSTWEESFVQLLFALCCVVICICIFGMIVDSGYIEGYHQQCSGCSLKKESIKEMAISLLELECHIDDRYLTPEEKATMKNKIHQLSQSFTKKFLEDLFDNLNTSTEKTVSCEYQLHSHEPNVLMPLDVLLEVRITIPRPEAININNCLKLGKLTGCKPKLVEMIEKRIYEQMQHCVQNITK